MLAKNIAHQAILAGHSALFTTAADLLLDLNGQETARALERRLRHYTRPSLLVVDEVGFLAYDARAADLLFQLVSRRYEHRSLLITTNLPFKQLGRGEKIHETVCRCGWRVPIREVCRARSTTATRLERTWASATLGTCGASNASNETRRS